MLDMVPHGLNRLLAGVMPILGGGRRWLLRFKFKLDTRIRLKSVGEK